jgi:hypothetical protein
LRGQDFACTEQFVLWQMVTWPSGYEADQKENIGPLNFKQLRANPLISLDYLADINRNRRKPL